MKQEIINRLRLLQKRIRMIVVMVERNKSSGVIIPKIDRAQKELADIKNLLLKCHVLTVLVQAGIRKNKQQKLLKLCGF